MISKKRLLLSVLVIAMVFFMTAYRQTPTQKELIISTAASLTDVMGDIAKKYKSVAPNVKLTFNFGSSGALQKQIEQGAPVDVFISAAAMQMTALQKGGFIIDGTKVDLLENKIVLIIPAGKTEPSSFGALNSHVVLKIALGEPSSVPVGQYSKEILTYLKIIDDLKAAEKIVYANDVREVLTWVETGNVDAGIVYATDAMKNNKVIIVEYAPEGSHKTVIYPSAVVKSSKNPDSARAFVNYLSTPEASELFQSYGFTTHAI